MTERKTYIPFIFVATVLYLIFELAFNARLLDVTGTMSSQSQIDNIEWWGRIISGIAVTLALWGTVLLPVMNKFKLNFNIQVFILVVSIFPVMSGVYYGEKNLVEHFVNISTPDERKDAVLLMNLRGEVANGNIKLDGVNLSNEELKSPEGKTLIALLPFEGFNVDNVSDKIMSSVKKTIGNKVSDNLGGDDKSVYNNDYRKENSIILEKFKEYNNAIVRLNHDHNKNRYNRTVNNIAGQNIPPGLTFEKFSMLPDIQKEIHSDIKIVSPLPMGLSFKSFDTIYKKNYDKMFSQSIEQIDYPASSMKDGEVHEKIGKDAMEGVIAPAIALVISILGALVHIFKSGNYFFTLLDVPFRKMIMATLVTSFIIFGWFSTNIITKSDGFQTIEKHNVEHLSFIKGIIVKDGIRWTIQTQPSFYPINETIRKKVLMGFSYNV